jgi:hypothetical protein
MSVTSTQWNRVCAALPEAVRQLRAVSRAVPPDLRVTPHWTAADTLAHLCTIAAMDVAMVTRDLAALPVPGISELRAATTVDTVSAMNAAVLSRYSERDTSVLLDRLDRDVTRLLEASGAAGAPAQVSWLGEANLPIDGLLAHLLNELDIHGWDIAHAARLPWRSDPAEAALFLDPFLVGVTRSGYGRLLDREGAVRPGRISVTFRPGYGDPVTLALVDGAVRVEPLDLRPDVRLTYDPVTLNRMLFGRVSKARAVSSGKVRIGGRRPWLLPAFMQTMRLPS